MEPIDRRLDREVISYAKKRKVGNAMSILGNAAALDGKSDDMSALSEIAEDLMKKFPIGSRILIGHIENGEDRIPAVIRAYEADEETEIITRVSIRFLENGATGSRTMKVLSEATLVESDFDYVAIKINTIKERVRPAIYTWLSKVPRTIDLENEITKIRKELMRKVDSKKRNKIATLNEISDPEILQFAKNWVREKYGYEE